MEENELAMLDQLLDKYTPRTILREFSDVMERRAAATLDSGEPPEDEAKRQDALSLRVSGTNLRNFSVRA